MSNKRQKFWFGAHKQLDTVEVTPVTVEAPEDTEIEITHLVSLNTPFEVLIIDGRLGEELLPLDGPIDLGFFTGEHTTFEVGTVTPDRPLKLYLQVWGTPSVLPFYNFTIVGWAKNWVAPTIKIEHQKRIGEIVVSDYKKWLNEQKIERQHHHLFLDPLEAYLRDKNLSEEAKTPGFSVLKRYLESRGLLGENVPPPVSAETVGQKSMRARQRLNKQPDKAVQQAIAALGKCNSCGSSKIASTPASHANQRHCMDCGTVFMVVAPAVPSSSGFTVTKINRPESP